MTRIDTRRAAGRASRTRQDGRPQGPAGRPHGLLLGCVLVAVSLSCGKGPAQEPQEPQVAPAGIGSDGSANSGPERLITARSRDENADSLDRIDPHRDGWDTEALASMVKKTLGKIGHRLEEDRPITTAEWAEVASPNVKGTALVPKDLLTAFEDATITVLRADADALAAAPMEWTGAAGLASALEQLRMDLGGASATHVKIKIVNIEATDDEVVTTINYQDESLRATGASQRSAIWRVHWEGLSTDLKFTKLTVQQYEQVQTLASGTTLMRDCTDSVLGAEPAFLEQLRYGSSYWAGRLEGFYSRTLLEAHMGVSVADVNGDGLDDVYVCQPGGLPNRLLLQNPDGSVRDGSAAAGVDVLDVSFSSLFVDLDNDGDQDLALLTGRRIFLFEGDGEGHFTERMRATGNFGYSLTSVDFDGDGDLDIYRCSYRPAAGLETSQFGQPVPLYNATNGGVNQLLRNDGDWQFEDATAATGLDVNNDRWSYAAAWEDYDNDGDQDLYVANDYGHNNLYRNDDGQFVDVAARLGALDANFGMSVTWGDMDHNGWMDLYVSNMFSAAGNRVVAQEGFKPGMTDEEKAPFLRLARGNTMLANRASETNERCFVDISEEVGTTMGRWSWGSLFTDINNDGWDDLLVANGYLTQESTQDL
ncbi:MAG: hypothetical protein ACI8QZ_001320 [Chlamydiales bacterium]|jgi:hypothetical protein